ncbi:toxin YdaT family protein [Escherichia sp. TWPC-MK]
MRPGIHSHPEALARNTQKIFRWVEKDTPDAVKKIQALAILTSFDTESFYSQIAGSDPV